MVNDRQTRPLDWLAVCLLVLMVGASAFGLVAANWTDNLPLVATVAVVGVLAGTALARSRFTPLVSRVFLLVYGLFFAFWQVGDTLDYVLSWHDRLDGLLGRLSVLAGALLHGQPNKDPLMFVLLMALLYWLLGALAGFWATRARRFWIATLPAGIVLLINAYYYLAKPGLDGYLIAYFLLALLLAARLHLSERQGAWAEERARVPTNAGAQITQISLLAAAGLVLVAWGTPALARSDMASEVWQGVSGPWLKLSQRLGQAFSSLRSPVVLVGAAHGDRLTLAAGVKPPERPILEAHLDSPMDPSGRVYWRVRTYDQYLDGTWTSTPEETATLASRDGDWFAPAPSGRQDVTFTITPAQQVLHTLYVPAQPVWVNRSVDASLTSTSSGIVDISMVNAQADVFQGESYRARGSIAIPSAADLRLARTEYPEWVRTRFLQLPGTVTARTLDLAKAIASGATAPYDQTMAVTSWLRRNIRYSLTTEAPPTGVEPVDWFLFDYGVGFCNWYASAEVIMLRSLGIPARLAVGYAQGEYDQGQRLFRVRGRDSHAWPEVYFPGYGWVEFEPTTGQPELIRPEAPTTFGSERTGVPAGSADRGGDFFENQQRRGATPGGARGLQEGGVDVAAQPRSVAPWVLLGILPLAVVLLWLRADPIARVSAWTVLGRGLARAGVRVPASVDRYRSDSLTPLGRLFFRWTQAAAGLGVPVVPSQTPFERAEAFARQRPEAGEAGWRIARAYVSERYGGQPEDEAGLKQVWRRLAPRLYLARAAAWFWRPLRRRTLAPGAAEAGGALEDQGLPV